LHLKHNFKSAGNTITIMTFASVIKFYSYRFLF